MSEFDEKLSSLLGNPDAMAQIMSLAQNLGGGGPSAPPEELPPVPDPPPLPSTQPDLSGLFRSLEQVDPRILQSGMQLLSEFSARDDEKTALLLSLKPFLSQQRRDKVDRAVQIARMTRLLRVAFRLFQGKGGSDV